MSGYKALYRTYRPQTFEGLIGQDPVVQTLVNQIKSDKIGHAYLFCGSRGTGKTSAAKIFARAVNCEHPQNGSPCLTCETCKSFPGMDVVEIDAASNNGVDEIRELREQVKYPPVNGKYKVYIIDEVHMLSAGAFNALLKTLEEPPDNVIFILATTEVQKLPATILSRCMRFDFRLVPDAPLAVLVEKILKENGSKPTKEAVALIVRAAEGGVRDALSIADMCLSYKTGALGYDDVLAVIGGSDGAEVTALAVAVLKSDAAAALTTIDALAKSGKSMSLLNKALLSTLRDLSVCKLTENPNEILKLPEARLNAVKASAAEASADRILRVMEGFSQLDQEFRYSTSPQLVMESAALRLCGAHDRLADLERRLQEIEVRLRRP
ncbi:MAG: DNA polymerase III subunit gamma/tau [Clostridiales bacterium]|jgi:DNA polymerase-3 subunit gamma/tau|nr:DNA polymerase III subunit gamma/tau [Clostridiales bacterium]